MQCVQKRQILPNLVQANRIQSASIGVNRTESEQ
jgi:hypothetical protein